MKSKDLEICCPWVIRERLAQALRLYSDAAYPPGGSECGQVARQSLGDTAAALARDPGVDGVSVAVSRRLRAMLKSAVNFYCDALEQQEGRSLHGLREIMLESARGVRKTPEDLVVLEGDTTRKA